MPIKDYSVLKCRAADRLFGAGANQHYQILVLADQATYRVQSM